MNLSEFKTKNSILYHGDCFDVFDKIENESIDLILTDLPYGKTACEWDKELPSVRMWEQVNRVSKDTTPICFFGMEPFASKLRLSNEKFYKYDWYWKKPRGTGHLNSKKQPLRDIETISIFYKKQPVYNPQYTEGIPYSKLKGGRNSKIKLSGETVYGAFGEGAQFRNDNFGIRYPKQTIEFGVVERGTLHPTQKPVQLLEYLIETYSYKNNTILDFTMGSGSTGVATINTNRKFIGIELDSTYFQIAKNRIEEAEKAKGLFA